MIALADIHRKIAGRGTLNATARMGLKKWCEQWRRQERDADDAKALPDVNKPCDWSC